MATGKPTDSNQNINETAVRDRPALAMADTGAPATVSDDKSIERGGFEKDQFEQNGVGRVMEAFMKRLEFLAQKEGNVAEATGAINNARSSTQKSVILNDKRKKQAKALRSALAQTLKLSRLQDEMAQHIRNIEVADKFIADLENGKQPELDADGSLKNKERERLIKEYEKRTGETVDRTNAEALLRAAREQREHELQQYKHKKAEVEKISPQTAENTALLKEYLENIKIQEAEKIEALTKQLKDLEPDQIENMAKLSQLISSDELAAEMAEKIKSLPSEEFSSALDHLETREERNNSREARGYEELQEVNEGAATGLTEKTEVDVFEDDYGLDMDDLLADESLPIQEERTTNYAKTINETSIKTEECLCKTFEKATNPNQPEIQEPALVASIA